jgi:CheY-like chemotaxis protein
MAGKPKTRILLVDDDHELVRVLTMVLEGAGFEVLAAFDAHEALAAAASERPDLIVLDVMMPEGTEGFHVVWHLRKRPEPYFQSVPIVILTAIHGTTPLRFYPDSGDGTYRAGEYLPVQGFVDKPVEPAALLAEVQRLLAAGRTP